MKAWLVRQFGAPDEMRLDDIPDPSPGPGEVLVAHRACGVNFFDILLVGGKYQARPPFPFIPGGEFAGVVERVGPGVETPRPGDAVMAAPVGGTFGGYAEKSVVRAELALPVPAGMSFEQAAAFPIVYQTSWFALNERGALQPGETLLVHAGASGVGMSAIQIGRAMGARVLATAGSEAKRAWCVELGAEAAFDYGARDWFDQVKATTGGRGADVIYDPVGGEVCELSTKCIAPGGRLLIVGFASGRIPALAANRLLLKNCSAVGVYWGSQAEAEAAFVRQTHARLADLFLAGELRPPAPRAFPFERAPEALAELAARRILGKAALTV